MLIDMTLKISPKMVEDAQGNERKIFAGHLGTHFDVMNKEFPLEYSERKAIIFDVSSVMGKGRNNMESETMGGIADIEIADIESVGIEIADAEIIKIEIADIEISDIDMNAVEKNMFVAFYTGFIEQEGYGSKKYFTQHPQLSHELIDALLAKNISIIGVDFAGIRRGAEHTPKDQYCADKNVFVIENLCNLKAVLDALAALDALAVLGDKKQNKFVAHTYPLNYSDMTGLPCQVLAKA